MRNKKYINEIILNNEYENLNFTQIKKVIKIVKKQKYNTLYVKNEKEGDIMFCASNNLLLITVLKDGKKTKLISYFNKYK